MIMPRMAGLVVLILAVMLLGPLVPVGKASADAQTAGTDYLGQTVQLNSFDTNDISSYGTWCSLVGRACRNLFPRSLRR